jgi:hypothetical protein
MISRRKERKKTYSVICIWCDEKIRDGKEEESTGVCLKCFYKVLSNHLRMQKKTPYGEFVSDR